MTDDSELRGEVDKEDPLRNEREADKEDPFLAMLGGESSKGESSKGENTFSTTTRGVNNEFDDILNTTSVREVDDNIDDIFSGVATPSQIDDFNFVPAAPPETTEKLLNEEQDTFNKAVEDDEQVNKVE